MQMPKARLLITATAAVLGATVSLADVGSEHPHDDDMPPQSLDALRELHEEHEHAHDFEALEGISAEDMQRTMSFLMDIGLVVPTMDSQRGAEAYMNKGCVVCHSVNGVGGEIGPALDAAEMPQPMNAFDFAARMWRGAPAMAQMQEGLMGQVITLSGQELADIVAFVHDETAQKEVTPGNIPEEFRVLIP